MWNVDFCLISLIVTFYFFVFVVLVLFPVCFLFVTPCFLLFFWLILNYFRCSNGVVHFFVYLRLYNVKKRFVMYEKIKTLGVGVVGAGSTEVVASVSSFDPAPITESVGLISQIIILVATLIGLFKKKK